MTSFTPSTHLGFRALSLLCACYVSAGACALLATESEDVSIQAESSKFMPPWEPQYKLSASDASLLTAADVVGPDGLVYPDWRMAGIAGGIPEMDTVVGAEAFTALIGADIASTLNEMIATVAASGGGAIELPAGEFLLNQPVVLRHSNVVIRGAGRDLTRLIYQEHIPYGELRATTWNASGIVGSTGLYEIQANPKNLVYLAVATHGDLLKKQQLRHHWGNRFSIRLSGEDLLQKLGAGAHQLEAEVRYANGDIFKQSFEVTVSADIQEDDRFVGQHGAVIFAGIGEVGSTILLQETAQRGETTLRLPEGHSIQVGDKLLIEAPCTERWNQIVGNVVPWGTFRSNHLEVVAVAGDEVTVSQPFRIDFPVEDGAFVRRIQVVENCGIEGLTIEQKVFTTDLVGPKIPETLWYPMEDLWADGVTSNYAWRCWIRDVRVENSGRNPIFLTRSKFCEVRDIDVRGAIFKGGGGSGYVGFERTFDSIMENAHTEGMRHAPDLQWASAGNVVRNSCFIGSDAQWHAGWTHENLFENNQIIQTQQDLDSGNGTYGHGFFATGPKDAAHGPQGPRNVIYNNDVSAPKNGMHLGGSNEAWIVLYNRFSIGGSRAIYGRVGSFDHTIGGNVFIMPNPKSPVILFGAPDCTGIAITDNVFYGPIQQVAGFHNDKGAFHTLEGNETFAIPEAGAASVPRPSPEVPSIFEYQRRMSTNP